MPRNSHSDHLDDEDPALQMWGVGKEIWAPEDGDTFIARERQESSDQSTVAPVRKSARGLKTRPTKP